MYSLVRALEFETKTVTLRAVFVVRSPRLRLSSPALYSGRSARYRLYSNCWSYVSALLGSSLQVSLQQTFGIDFIGNELLIDYFSGQAVNGYFCKRIIEPHDVIP